MIFIEKESECDYMSLADNTRVLHQDERSKSSIEYREYNFPDSIGLQKDDLNRPIKAFLREKTYTKSGNISCYFETNDAKLGKKKVILTVRPERKYRALRSNLDMRSVPINSPMIISIGQGAKYLVWLLASLDKTAD